MINKYFLRLQFNTTTSISKSCLLYVATYKGVCERRYPNWPSGGAIYSLERFSVNAKQLLIKAAAAP